MRKRIGAWVVTATAAVLIAMPAAVHAQNAGHTASALKTPWGDPNLQGVWSNATTTPLQRPAKWAGRYTLTK
jgi:hypothetical protein